MFDFQQKRGGLMISCEKLKKSPLFKGIEEEGISAVLSCLAPSQKTYRKGQSIFRIGDSITDIGFILRGSVLVEKEDFWGNRSILVHLRESDIFGESFASLGAKGSVQYCRRGRQRDSLSQRRIRSDLLFLRLPLPPPAHIKSFIRHRRKKHGNGRKNRCDVTAHCPRKASHLSFLAGAASRLFFL